MRRKGDIKLLVLLLFYCLVNSALSQNLSSSYLESLGYEELLTEFDSHDGDSINQEAIARTYLERARAENDTIKMARGYDRLARIFHPEKNVKFADSIIELTNNLKNKTYPALGYIIKGYHYNVRNDIVNSTNNLYKAYDKSVENDNVPQQLFILHLLIINQSKWGDKTKALALQEKRHSILMSPNYIKSLRESTRSGAHIDLNQLFIHDQILSYGNYFICHYNLNNVDSTEFYFNKLKSKISSYHWVGLSKYLEFLQEAEVELQFLKENYYQTKILAKLMLKEKIDSISPESKLNLYQLLGSSEFKLNNKDEGIGYLKKADSLIDSGEVLIEPRHRDIFLTFNSYYEEKNDLKGQISSLNKLIELDSLLAVYHQHFEPNLVREIDMSILINKKEALIKSLNDVNFRTKRTSYWILFFLILTLGLLIYYFHRQKVYKSRFNKLINEKKPLNQGESQKYTYEISTTIINSIIEKLHQFEKDKSFLNHDVSLHSLSSLFETNPNYLSRVINARIGKNFSQYINDLRIDYAISNLLNDSKLRKYTIKAIAEECGYKNSESFSKAFYKRNGIYPSYYIKQLEKSQGATNQGD
ncbi:AraC family transcriptional regulator [Aureitalea sp. L0-47]|uniref:helix-turn-helix domain-containing protein n=1 Tax=Aureitalea sp. L0-47 TaxID=2816962 RepID=UPI0022375AE7|nr:helix-turn-helix domain-containing protein [Aureitalea sp. L0-47]MCW5519515.1 AraC family transcriptional regulator [Aureitalea sp. L0-47]